MELKSSNTELGILTTNQYALVLVSVDIIMQVSSNSLRRILTVEIRLSQLESLYDLGNSLLIYLHAIHKKFMCQIQVNLIYELHTVSPRSLFKMQTRENPTQRKRSK